ncbi:hypothetical protein ACE1SV_65060 [Streptomyces sp. E-15]
MPGEVVGEGDGQRVGAGGRVGREGSTDGRVRAECGTVEVGRDDVGGDEGGAEARGGEQRDGGRLFGADGGLGPEAGPQADAVEQVGEAVAG